MLLQAYDFLHLFDDQRLPAPAGGERPVGEHHHGHRAHPQGAPPGGVRAHDPARAQGRRDEVRQDRVRNGVARRADGRARTSCTNSSSVPRTAVVGDVPARTSPFSTTTPSWRSTTDTAAHPEQRKAQRALAREVCTFVHGEDEATPGRAAAQALYCGEDGVARRASRCSRCARRRPTATRARRTTSRRGCALVDALVDAGLATSKSQARTPRDPGRRLRERPPGARHRGAPSAAADLLFDHYLVLRKGAGLPSRAASSERVDIGTRRA